MKVGKVDFQVVTILLEGDEWWNAQSESSLMLEWPKDVKNKKGQIIRKAPNMPVEGDGLTLKGISPARKGVVTGTIYQVLPMMVNGFPKLYIAFDKRIPA